MAEKVKNTGVSKEKGYLYYLDKEGDVSRSQMARAGKAVEMLKKLLQLVLQESLVSYILLIKMVMYQDHQWPEVVRNRICS